MTKMLSFILAVLSLVALSQKYVHIVQMYMYVKA